MEVEGYPGLVVHGPLTTFIDFARDQNPERRIVAYTTFELRGRPTAGRHSRGDRRDERRVEPA